MITVEFDAIDLLAASHFWAFVALCCESCRFRNGIYAGRDCYCAVYAFQEME